MRLCLGRLAATPGALAAIGLGGVTGVLARHQRGDWGCVCEEDRAANKQALRHGARVFSAYVVNGTRVWVITEADRSVTTVLLPDEY